MNNVDRYIRQIERHMHCSRKIKKELLDDYRKNLAYNNVENDTLSELYREFDEPHIVAENLMGLVSEKEIRQHQLKKKLVFLISTVVLVVVLTLACVALMNSSERRTVEEPAVKDTTIYAEEIKNNEAKHEKKYMSVSKPVYSDNRVDLFSVGGVCIRTNGNGFQHRGKDR